METTTPANVVLSDEQVAITDWGQNGTGNLVIAAGAGCGKTFTSKKMILVAPEAQVLYAVFGRKNRIEAEPVFADQGRRVDVKTLHSLGKRFCDRGPWGQVEPDDSIEADRIAHVLGDRLKLVPDKALAAIKELVAWAKNTTVAMPTTADLARMAIDDLNLGGIEDPAHPDYVDVGRVAAVALEALQLSTAKAPGNRISFDDMVWLPVVMGWVQKWYSLVVVDEAQDMNAPQLEMAIRACKRGGRICVIGDDRQAIFGFRGAVQGALGVMQQRLNAKVLTLSVTRRCPKAVVALAATMVPTYKAAPEAPEGTVQEIGGEFVDKLVVGDAVVSRVNAPLVAICLQLLKKGTTARIEGKDIGKALAATVRKIGGRSVPDFLQRARAWEARQAARLKQVKGGEALLEGVRDQISCLVELARDCKNVGEIETRVVALFEDSVDAQTGAKNPKPAVVLSSTHKAKGLEWPNVYVLRSTFKIKGHTTVVSEEANLFYVAVTRAKAALYLVG